MTPTGIGTEACASKPRLYSPRSLRISSIWADATAPTDDSQMLLALAASLVNSGGDCRAADVATEYAKAFDPNRGYGESAEKARTARCENSALHRYQQVCMHP